MQVEQFSKGEWNQWKQKQQIENSQLPSWSRHFKATKWSLDIQDIVAVDPGK